MLSQTAEYALRAVVCLGARPEKAQTAQAIAAYSQVPAPYLAKVLKDLARVGLLRSQRGREGGFMLARPAGEMSVLSVVNAIDPLKRILVCPLDRPEHSGQLCPLHQRLDEAAAYLERSFAAWTIADLVTAGSLQPLSCQFPVPEPSASCTVAALRGVEQGG